jgi:hypothetical protein
MRCRTEPGRLRLRTVYVVASCASGGVVGAGAGSSMTGLRGFTAHGLPQTEHLHFPRPNCSSLDFFVSGSMTSTFFPQGGFLAGALQQLLMYCLAGPTGIARGCLCVLRCFLLCQRLRFFCVPWDCPDREVNVVPPCVFCGELNFVF